MNHIPIRLRLKELLIDYLVILAHLVALFIVNIAIVLFIFKEMPAYSETQSQLIAAFTLVIPIIFIFSYLDFYKYGSIGKRAGG